MGRDIRSAKDFFNKYGLDEYLERRIDKDLTREGVQNDSVDVDEAVADYLSLPAADRYAVFVRLRNGGDEELLKLAVNVDGRMGPFRKSFVRMGEAFDEVIADIRSRADGRSDIWGKRVEIAEGIFAVDVILAASGFSTVEPLKRSIASGLSMLYYETWDEQGAAPGGNPLFDTDNDLDPYARRRSWDSAFDDRDVLPLDERHSSDRDGDGVGDGLDVKSSDPSRWTKLKVGERVEGHDYSVRRVSKDEFEISRTFTVGADPMGNVDEIKRTLLSDEQLSERAMHIEEAFAKAVEPGRYKFSLNVEFKATDGPYPDILFSDRDIRSHWKLWGGSLLYIPNKMLHEVFHLFGEPDYYNEVNVHAGVRDFTTRPGYGILAEKHLMACAADPVIPQNLLLKLAASAPLGGSVRRHAGGYAENGPAPKEENRSILDDVPSHLDGREIMFQRGPIGNDSAKLQELIAALNTDIAGESNSGKRDALLFAKANALFMLGKKAEASQLMMEVFERNKGDDALTYRMQSVLKAAGDLENALKVNNYRIEHWELSFDGYIRAGILSDMGRDVEAVMYLEDLLKVVGPKEKDYLRILWTDCLIRLGEHERIDAYIASKRGDSKGYAAVMAAKRYMLSNDLARATDLYWRYKDRDNSFDEQIFVFNMREAGFEKESVEWFMKHIFPSMDARNENDAFSLNKEISRCRENGFDKEAIPLYEALLKRDPYNVELNAGLAMALFAAGRNEDAVRALAVTGSAYEYMADRSLMHNLSYDDLVKKIKDEMFQKGFKDVFLGNVDEVRKDPLLLSTSEGGSLVSRLVKAFERDE